MVQVRTVIALKRLVPVGHRSCVGKLHKLAVLLCHQRLHGVGAIAVLGHGQRGIVIFHRRAFIRFVVLEVAVFEHQTLRIFHTHVDGFVAGVVAVSSYRRHGLCRAVRLLAVDAEVVDPSVALGIDAVVLAVAHTDHEVLVAVEISVAPIVDIKEGRGLLLILRCNGLKLQL